MTALGHDLQKPVSALGDRALKNAERVEKAQRKLDAAREPARPMLRVA